MKMNLIIRASAGTGKTFSLATRFLRLMIFNRVAPEKIVALTFSRAAAQEIYTKLLERLWTAAMKDEAAAREKETLLKGFSAEDVARIECADLDWSRRGFAALLKRVVEVQHYNAIATLDSFILRIVKCFPLEMGFQNAVDVLDTYGEERAIAKAQDELLSARSDRGTFAADFKTAQHGDFVRTCAQALGNTLKGWRAFVLQHPDSVRWTVASMRQELGIDLTERPDLEPFAATGNNRTQFEKFKQHYAAFTGAATTLPDVFPKNNTGAMMQFFLEHPDATCFEYETNGARPQRKTCELGAAGAAALRRAVAYMANLVIDRSLDVIAAKLRLCGLIEGVYDQTTRRQGLLTFGDFTDCQATNEDSEQGLRLENLQYRFDTLFDHWALDEFQDTSELQWKCLRRLVREAADDGARSVMAVGDLKQSIYTWRGGNDAPFKEMMQDWPEFAGEEGEIVKSDVSYRYEKHTADFVNAVFGPGNISPESAEIGVCRDAAARWLEEDCWMVHRPDRKNGKEKDGDYVEVIGVSPAGGDEDGEAEDPDHEEEANAGTSIKLLASSICAKVRDLWREHEAVNSTETIGILVRSNRDGAYLAERLRSLEGVELPVVWEGASGILDAPVVRAVLELLKLADHPEDRFAWGAVNTLFPVRELALPDCTTPGKASAAISRMLSRQGLARTLKDIVARLTVPSAGLDPRSVERLETLVREGVNFEERREGTVDFGKFPQYLAATAGREVSSSPHVIRILSIHRSKGLTLDHVIVPILESGDADSIVAPRKGTVYGGEGWVVGALPEAVAKLNPKTAAAWRRAANDRFIEQLRMYYVALTRARKSTYVMTLVDDHSRVQFRDLLVKPFSEFETEDSDYGMILYRAGEVPVFGRKDGAAPVARTPWTGTEAARVLTRRSPSAEGAHAAAGTAFMAGALFSDRFGTAAEEGTRAHARFASIEWIDPAHPRDETETWILAIGWREAFVATPSVTGLWRERSYERQDGEVWETGQFDRVVFTNAEGVRGAIVYDFKTNALRAGETAEQFAVRMGDAYAGQMQAYRRALASLTGLAAERIRTVLLLQATGAAVVVP